MFHVYAFAAKTFNTMLMSSTPPQGEESINFDKQKDLDVLKHLSPKTANQRLAEFKELPKNQFVFHNGLNNKVTNSCRVSVAKPHKYQKWII